MPITCEDAELGWRTCPGCLALHYGSCGLEQMGSRCVDTSPQRWSQFCSARYSRARRDRRQLTSIPRGWSRFPLYPTMRSTARYCRPAHRAQASREHTCHPTASALRPCRRHTRWDHLVHQTRRHPGHLPRPPNLQLRCLRDGRCSRRCRSAQRRRCSADHHPLQGLRCHRPRPDLRLPVPRCC